MRKAITLLLTILTFTVYGQDVNIPDANFKSLLLSNSAINTNNDTEIQLTEAQAFTGTINVNGNGKLNSQKILDLTGIEAFVNITKLFCYNNLITSLDVSKNTKLTELRCDSNRLNSLDVASNTTLVKLNISGNSISTIDITKNTALTEFVASGCSLSSLDITKNTQLLKLFIHYNNISTLDLSKNTSLTELGYSNNSLNSIDVSKNTRLEVLGVASNQLISLDVTKNINLRELYTESNKLTNIDLTKNSALKKLTIRSNQLTGINLTQNILLEVFSASSNKITSIDFTKNTALKDVDISFNQLSSIDVSKNTSLTSLSVDDNQLTSLDITKNTSITQIACRNNKIARLDLTKNTQLLQFFGQNNKISALDISNSPSMGEFVCSTNQLTSLNVANGNNANLFLDASGNSNLTCIQIDANFTPTSWVKDSGASYNTSCTTGPRVNVIFHVSTRGNDSNDGFSWGSALRNVQTALAKSGPGDQIWVAKGIYYADEGQNQVDNDRNSTFQLKNNVKMYGGFSGKVNSLRPRNPARNETILSGDLDQNDDSTFKGTNSYNVIRDGVSAYLDGFTIMRGLADGVQVPLNSGGGVYNATSTYSNCVFKNNKAVNGGAIYYIQTSATKFINCKIIGNSANDGGGIYEMSDPNAATVKGTEHENLLIANNYASNNGGGIFTEGGVIGITNATITGNVAVNTGGGIYNFGSAISIRNAIIWNNQASNSTNSPQSSIAATNVQSLGLHISLVANYTPAGQTGGTNGVISNADPMFIQQALATTSGNLRGDYRLKQGSPATDSGDNTVVTLSKDLLGNKRIQNNAVDLGAYEGSFQKIYHVSTRGSDTNDGFSWKTSLRNLQTALSRAGFGDQIWVAKGTYYPDEGASQTDNDRTSSFALKDGVIIYGGFSGSETLLKLRNIATNLTVLSGDLEQNDTTHPIGNNSYHVVSGSGMLSPLAELNGFIITRGWANGSTVDLQFGGGMYLKSNGQPTIRNCSFIENGANVEGACLYIEASSPIVMNTSFSHSMSAGAVVTNKLGASSTFTNCTFFENTGGAVFNFQSSPIFVSSTFINNTATGSGGGMLNDGASPNVINSRFLGNAASSGGAIYNINSANPTFTNNLIAGNKAATGGGIFNWTSSSPTFVNCTITGNKADSDGGGIFNDNAQPNVHNTIVWNNQANGVTNTIASSVFESKGSSTTYKNSLIANFTNVTGVILSSDPVFARPINPANAPATKGDFRFLSTSVIVDAGDNSLNALQTDIRGNQRIKGSKIDLGAIEGGITIRVTTWNGNTDNDWKKGSNWSHGVPTKESDAIIGTGSNMPVIKSGELVELKSLTLNVGTTLVLNSNARITIDENFSNPSNAGILLANPGSSIMVKGDSEGSIIYKRTLATGNWYYMSSPVTTQDTNGFVSTNSLWTDPSTPSNRGLRTYNNQIENWELYQNGTGATGNLVSGKGYGVRLAAQGDVLFTGQISTKDVGIPVSVNVNGFNFVGNPYPSYIALNKAAGNSNVFEANNGLLSEETLWLWNENNQSFEAINKASRARYIAPGQGFFVNAKYDGVFNFQESMQSHQNDNFQRTANTNPSIQLNLNNGSVIKSTEIIYTENGGTTGFDDGFDSSVFELIPSNFQVYTHLISDGFGQKLNIQSLPNSNYGSMIIPIGVKANSGASLTFTLNATNIPSGYQITLEDKVDGTMTRLDIPSSSYNKTLTSNLDGIGRFFLHMTAVLSSEETVAEEIHVSTYFSSENELKVVGIHDQKVELSIYNIQGREVVRSSFTGNGANTIVISNMKLGIYIVQIQTDQGRIVKKILKQR